METVLIFGVEIISEVYRLNCKSGATKEAFGRCMSATRADAASERCTLLTQLWRVIADFLTFFVFR